MLAGEFHLPVAFDLTATFLFAITGTPAGLRRITTSSEYLSWRLQRLWAAVCSATVLAKDVPLLFKPGQFYELTAVAGAVVFVSLALSERMDVEHAALVAIGSTFLLRVLAIRFDWRRPAMVWEERE